MYNPDQQQHAHQFMAPRMSFSDFALEPLPPPQSGPGRASTGDADFEFSLGSGRPTMTPAPADQLFSKGRILPLREAPVSTLREELRAHDPAIARHRRASRPASGARWKELLGLKRSHKKGAAAESAGEGASTHDHVDLGDRGE